MRRYRLFSALVAAVLQSAAAVKLDINDPSSIRHAASIIASGVMSYYSNGAPGVAADQVGLFPYPPYYWWESGAVWGGMVDYWAYTGDSTYLNATVDAFNAQVGPNYDLIVPTQVFDEGNDDEGFWALSAMTALEYSLPALPNPNVTYLSLTSSVFDQFVERWKASSNSCGGGLKWQFYPQNLGYDYKSAVANGAFFQLAARLARYTGNKTYTDWAETVWDWTERVKMINNFSQVYDGTSDILPNQNCTQMDRVEWSYNNAIFMYGAANMWNVTGAIMWKERLTSLLSAASHRFFSFAANSTGVMFESACETIETCNTDQYSFKAYLARWMAKSTALAPFVAEQVWPLLTNSSIAAAKSCSGGHDGTTCGQKWYVGGYDGNPGLGQQLSAMECIQSHLFKFGDPPALPDKGGVAPLSSSISPVATAASTTAAKSGVAKGGSSSSLSTSILLSQMFGFYLSSFFMIIPLL